VSPGIWFCTSCTKKRLQFGLHSIVDEIESVWDVKEAEGKYNFSYGVRNIYRRSSSISKLTPFICSMFVGMQNSKQYFVKYKNLAHVHNRWVLEGDINVMPGGPDLLSLFNKRNHTEKVIACAVNFILLCI
jgi:chromodomain-helicase-DNA-binding protein 3